jgi:hypothetical protein
MSTTINLRAKIKEVVSPVSKVGGRDEKKKVVRSLLRDPRLINTSDDNTTRSQDATPPRNRILNASMMWLLV